jgi:hypothetical protein
MKYHLTDGMTLCILSDTTHSPLNMSLTCAHPAVQYQTHYLPTRVSAQKPPTDYCVVGLATVHNYPTSTISSFACTACLYSRWSWYAICYQLRSRLAIKGTKICESVVVICLFDYRWMSRPQKLSSVWPFVWLCVTGWMLNACCHLDVCK